MPEKAARCLTALGLVIAAGCSSGGAVQGHNSTDLPLPMSRGAIGSSVSKYISHVVVIIQENRSFENFFAGYPGADAPTYGCTAGGRAVEKFDPQTRRAGPSPACPPGDTVVPLHEITFKGPDLQHDYSAAIADWDNGNMDGFYQFGNQQPDGAYAYVERSLIAPYWYMAEHYVLADAMFPTEFGGSFTGHLTLVAGTDNLRSYEAEVDFPNGKYDDCDSPPGTRSSYLTPDHVKHSFQGPFPCFDQWVTMAQDLDAAGVSWKIYATKRLHAGFWEPYEAMSYVRRGPDWTTDVIAPQTQVLHDAQTGHLAAVSWVTPSREDSDHPQYRSDRGPSWVASVVNAIGETPYWKSTAIVVVWDDWGGWYDSAPPEQLDYRGLGIRVPCLIVSPYPPPAIIGQLGYVAHTQYEWGSILKFIEETFNLPSLSTLAGEGKSYGYTDVRAHSIDDAFDFARPPRPFAPIPTKYSIEYFEHEPPSNAPVDTQ